MTNTLIIYLNSAWIDAVNHLPAGDLPTQELEWSLQSEASTTVPINISLIQDIEIIRDEPPLIRIIIPAEYTYTSKVQIPSKAIKHARQAIPFLLEDQLSSEIEANHFAIHRTQVDNEFEVICMSNSLLDNLIKILARADIRPTEMYVDSQLLPIKIGTLSLLTREDRVLARSENTFTATNSNNISMLIDASCKAENITHIDVYQLDNTPENTLINDASTEIDGNVEVNRIKLGIDAFNSLTRQITDKASLTNLLQGTYQPADLKQVQAPQWQPIVKSALMCSLVYVMFCLSAGIYYQHQGNQHQAQAEEIYRQYFPQDKKVISIKNQLLGHINNNQTDHNKFLNLVNTIGGIWPQNPKITLQQLRYDQANGDLLLEVTAQNIKQLDNMTKSLQEQGLEFNLISANDNNDGVIGRLKMGDR